MGKRYVILLLVVLGVTSASSELPLQHSMQRVHPDTECLLSKMYDRGIFLFMTREYAQAVDKFSYILNSSESSEGLVGAALWGRAWANACLGNNEELIEDLDRIAILAGLYESCDCNTTTSFAFAKSFSGSRSFQFGEDFDGKYGFKFVNDPQYCIDTVDNCSRYLKALCVVIKDPGARTTLYLFVDGLADKAKNCCRAGGIWKECVQKMVDTMNKWNMLGIPADPYWD